MEKNNVLELINKKQQYIETINNMKETIFILKTYIDKINDKIMKRCHHEWIIDNTYEDHHTVKICSHCGLKSF